MPDPASHFLRHTPADPDAHRMQIGRERADLEAAVSRGDAVQTLDHAGNLGSLLTSERRESEAYDMLRTHLATAGQLPGVEASAWLVHALATAAQYVGKHDEANGLFADALQLAQANGWRTLAHFVLHHWGRCLAEQGRMQEARERFEQSLAIRQELGDPRQESSRRALAELARLEALRG